MQRDFSLFIQIKLNFGVTSWCFFLFFFWFSMCMVTFLRNHPNFQNLFVWTNTNMIFVLYLTLNSQKSLWTCAIMHSWKKRETHPKILGVVVSCLTIMLNVLFGWKKQQKWRYVMKTEKHMILFNKKGSFDKESLMKLWAKLPTQIGTGWNKNQEVLKAWSNWGRFFFFFFFCRTRIGSIMHRWCNSPSVSHPTKAFAEIHDCVEALDYVCPQFLRAESLLGFEQRWYVVWKELP
jgi:hypothetical protein